MSQFIYVPIVKEIYDQIVAMDKTFFNAYNHCDMEKQSEIYSDSIEFFHDKGGLNNSKKEILEATKNNICNEVTREIVPGSIEVYPINNYGAVEIGFHKFHNKEESGAPSNPSKFIIVWHQTKEGWEITKVISLH